MAGNPVILIPGVGFKVITAMTLCAGTMFLVWLGEQVSERGIGNGISIIIFGSIVAGLPSAIAGTLELARTGSLSGGIVLVLFMLTERLHILQQFYDRHLTTEDQEYLHRQQLLLETEVS